MAIVHCSAHGDSDTPQHSFFVFIFLKMLWNTFFPSYSNNCQCYIIVFTSQYLPPLSRWSLNKCFVSSHQSVRGRAFMKWLDKQCSQSPRSHCSVLFFKFRRPPLIFHIHHTSTDPATHQSTSVSLIWAILLCIYTYHSLQTTITVLNTSVPHTLPTLD